MDLAKLELKIDKVEESLHAIDKTLTKQEENLREHMRRTTIAERNHELLRAEFKPVAAHVNRVEGALKLLGLIALLISIIIGITKLHFKG